MSTFKGSIDIFYASAGTGKTTTLLKQMVDLDPERTRFVTFSRAGRFQAQMASSIYSKKMLKTVFTTIHSLCFRSLKVNSRSLFTGNYRLRELERRTGLSLVRKGIDKDDVEYTWDQLRSQMYLILENLRRVNPQYYEKVKTHSKIDMERLAWFILEYIKFKKENEYLDFTDLLEQYIEQKKEESNIDTLLVDEAQDCSPLQWSVLIQGFSGVKRIFIAGDDKQSLFTFAGASPTQFARFKGQLHYLDISYRVPSTILEYATRIADNISDIIKVPVRSVKKGGFLQHITHLDQIKIIPEKTYLFLARNRVYLRYYIQWCLDNGILYLINFESPFKPYDYYDFDQRNGMYERWPQWKKDFFNKVKNPRDRAWVNITTIHSCKGTEADYVCVMSDISKNVSQGLSYEPDNEHRVFYVACTRAKEGLYIMKPMTKLYYPYLER